MINLDKAFTGEINNPAFVFAKTRDIDAFDFDFDTQC